MTPPLPAASRPSKMTTILRPCVLMYSCDEKNKKSDLCSQQHTAVGTCSFTSSMHSSLSVCSSADSGENRAENKNKE